MTNQGLNLHRISLRRQVYVEGNISGDFTAQKIGFPYSPSGRPDTRVQTPSSKIHSPLKFRTAHRTRATESIRLQEVRKARRTRTTESTRLQGSPNADAMTVDEGTILCNCLDVRVASPNPLQ
jgi:hypothetical protein